MLLAEIADDLDNVIRFADALAFLGCNNSHQDLTGAQCATLIDEITGKLTPIAEKLQQELNNQRFAEQLQTKTTILGQRH